MVCMCECVYGVYMGVYLWCIYGCVCVAVVVAAAGEGVFEENPECSVCM